MKKELTENRKCKSCSYIKPLWQFRKSKDIRTKRGYIVWGICLKCERKRKHEYYINFVKGK